MVKLGTTLGLLSLLLAFGCGGSDRGGSGNPGDDDNNPTGDAGTDPAPGVEICNGSDDNGNGLVDESCGCGQGETQACFPGPVTQNALERCKLGVQACDPTIGEFGGWGTCEGYVECDVFEKEFVYGEEENVRPVDIVMVVDQSESMDAEIAGVKANLNSFTTTLNNSGIDFRFILLAKRGTGTYDMCVPAPLGGANCADGTRFKQVDSRVYSNDALYAIQQRIDPIEAFMREDSLRVFIVITDDNARANGGTYINGSYMSTTLLLAQPFHDFLLARPGYSDYVFHSVIGDETNGSPLYCDDTADTGTEYLMLSDWTEGLTAAVCTPDWSATFKDFATNILSRTLLYPLSDDPENPLENLPYDVVALDFVDPKTGTRIPQPRGTVWDYNPKTNSVTLFDGFTPSNGTKMIVKYRQVNE